MSACTFCGGTRTTHEGEACPPCDGTGLRPARQADHWGKMRPETFARMVLGPVVERDFGCRLLTPDQRQRILMRLDALETKHDQLRVLLAEVIQTELEQGRPEDHDADCVCPPCLAWWLEDVVQADISEIREVIGT